MLIINANNNDNLLNNSNNKIHIRLLKRTSRKSFTIIQGMNFDEEKTNSLIKKIKTKFCCAGFKKKMDEFNEEVIQLTGDFRIGARDFLVSEYKISLDDIILHGSD